jgi:phosphoserine aminotransferase
MTTVYNFNPGPAVLPRPVLEHVQRELLDYQGGGLSILEMSHRSREYEAVNQSAETRMKRLLGVGDDYRVLFVQGGASTQFAMVPMNLLQPGTSADYILTGTWSEKAHEEARKLGEARVAASTKAEKFRRIPDQSELDLNPEAAYVHMTTNNTLFGTQWRALPDVGDRPLVADMSSDFLSRPLDAQRFALIYAGAQKNIGPAGVTVVVIHSSLLEQKPVTPLTMFQYATYAKNNSLYNTPPVFAVYMVDLVLQWIEDEGGLQAIGQRNIQKAAAVYNAVDRSGGFYRGHAEPASRSQMNATFRLPSEELEKQFVREAKAAGMVGLAGHRSVGGIRVSMYNAMSLEGCETLASFMDEFMQQNG